MKKTAIALLALTATTAAFATPTANNFYVGAKVGESTYHKSVRFQDKNQDKALAGHSHTSYGLFGGYRFTDHLSAEAGWQKFGGNEYNINGKDTSTHSANALDLGVKVNQFINKFNVYGGLGLSVVQNKLPQGLLTYGANAEKAVTKYTPSAYASTGLEYYFVDQFALGVEYKVNVRSFATAGKAELAEGSKETYAPAIKSVANTEAGAQTNRSKYKPDVHFLQATATYVFGQNKPAVVAAPVAPVAPVEVKAPVIERQKFSLKGDVLFATNKYDINPTVAAAQFSEILSHYRTANQATVDVVGHADRTGDAAKNQVLSENRAKAVADYLVNNGVDSSKLTYKGVGSSEPVTDGCYNVKNRTALRACLAPDRRVDVFISGYKETTK